MAPAFLIFVLDTGSSMDEPSLNALRQNNHAGIQPNKHADASAQHFIAY